MGEGNDSKIIEATKTAMCNECCKYPCMEVPEGKSEGWLYEDDESPCIKCLLNNDHWRRTATITICKE